jgi:hypothetical protein
MTRNDVAAEARRLAEAAVEANDRGDAAAAKALLSEARALDRDAVEEVLGGQKGGSA